MRGIRLAALPMLTGLLLTGCSPAKQEAEEPASVNIVVGFAQVGAESDWRIANTESMRSTFTEEKGYDLLFNDAKQKQENQIAAIRNYVLQDVNYIVLAPVIESGWDEVLQETKDAGIPVIVVDRMVDTEDENLFTAWVGSDTYWEGETAVEWLETYLEEQGRQDELIRILHVQGTTGATPQLGRTAGLDQGLKNHANWTLAARVEGEFTQAKAYEEVAEVLAEDPDIDVIYCENDNSAFGAMQALDEAGITYGTGGDVIIISFDATNAGLTACLEGKIDLDVECNPLHGPRVEKIIEQLEAGAEPEKYSYVEETYFTPETLTQDLIDKRQY
jgi:simple sugar transport system substrate-binding protein